MFTKISNFLGKYFYGCDTGVVRMDNALQQFRSVIKDLDIAAKEIADQRAMLSVEKDALLSQVDDIDDQMSAASANEFRALTVCRHMTELLGD